ncbi:hypothetical protein [Brachybacterium squillarum]|uniref:hypothetical protein n=1 Tax=Brachybacterium squillarum TaxID=661979 RepID=UPI00026297AF|nr:hypothetical protein [Brachybacterium squillarum]
MPLSLVTVVFLLLALVVAVGIVAVVALPNMRDEQGDDPLRRAQRHQQQRTAARSAERHRSRTGRP